MIQEILNEKYGEYLIGLDIYETKSSLILSRIIIKPEMRNSGVGTNIMEDLINYADNNKQIIALTPSSDFGGNKNKLTQFYKRFGFKHNKGIYKSFEFRDAMIRYPKLNESMKSLIKNILKENTDKTITCNECGWHWKESQSDASDLYVCHKCGHDNSKDTIKESNKPKIKSLLRERLLTQDDLDVRQVADFVNFAKDFLKIDDDVKVELAFERTEDLKTTAYYRLDGLIKIYAKNRAIIDIMRSLGHELVHHKQNLEGRLTNPTEDGEDGSEIENEANAVAGKMIRIYGKQHPEIYV
jgi:N-acetylglutamate synthase-like GNAT family acetyltransferase